MKLSTRAALVAVASVALIGAIPSQASAGEIKGTGDPIAVKGNSACAFSGLEDHPAQPGVVQN